MFKRTIDTVCDNAMLYKDITQWLRNRTFLALFFGLLAISEMVGVICVSVPSEAGEMGPIAFSVLSGVLVLFGLVIAVMGLTLTYREITSRTFELYALSGMSLERMMSGKLVSMLAQFFFCFCCIVPFMFFSFLLGGLDFYLIFAVTLCIALAFPPLCLFSLFVALHFRFKGIGMLVWGGGIVLAVLVVGYASLIFMITIATRTSMPFGKPLDFFKALIAFDFDAWWGFGVFLLFYVQVCLLLFYLCCNAISPPQDSREHFVKFFAFSLTATFLTTLVCATGGRETLISGGVGAFAVSCAIGLCYFYRTFDVPLMVAKRHRQRRPGLWRALGFLFAPGPWGTLRTIVLIALAACAFTAMAISARPPGALWNAKALSYALLPCQAPFFLVFPAGFLLNFDRYRERPELLRNAVLVWWVAIGTALLLVVATFSDAQRGGDLGSSQAATDAVCQLLAYILSPVSAVGIGLPNYTDVGTSLPWFRLVLGALGVYLAIRSISRTASRNRAERDKALGMAHVATPPSRGGPELRCGRD
jgi:hypothetical protein